jgi:hypothetical protein
MVWPFEEENEKELHLKMQFVKSPLFVCESSEQNYVEK